MKPMDSKKRKPDSKPPEITNMRKMKTTNDQSKEDEECNPSMIMCKEVPYPQHPNILMPFDSTNPIDGTKVCEQYAFNLLDLKRESLQVMTFDQWRFIALDILRQTMETLLGLKTMYQVAHGNLEAENVVVQFVSEELLGPDSVFHVKLRNCTRNAGTDRDFQQDFANFGRIVKQLLEDESGNMCAELSDLTSRITKIWSTDNLVKPEDSQLLSNLFEEEFLHSTLILSEYPAYWDSQKWLDFIAAIDEFVEIHYREKRESKASVKEFVSALKAFKFDDVRKDESKGFRGQVGGFVSKKGKKRNNKKEKKRNNVIQNTRKGWRGQVTSFVNTSLRKRGMIDRDSITGLIHIMRHIHTHFLGYSLKKQEQLGGHDCYPYFKERFPSMFMHVYRCMELWYSKMKEDLSTSFSVDFTCYFPKRLISDS